MLSRVAFALATVLVAGPIAARADDDQPLPARVEAAAKAAFAEAQAADRAGDRKTAIERYRKVDRIAPHPNVSFNLADVLRRDHDLRGAAAAYREYLTRAPGARDRAKVERLIRQLEATPGELDISSNDDTAVLYVDGVKRDRGPPWFLEMAPGPHRFDAFTALSFRSLTHDVDFDRSSGFSMTMPARVDGNLVVSGSGWLGRPQLAIDGDDDFRVAELITVTAGERAFEIVKDGCRWGKTVEVTADDVTYVFVDVPNPRPIGKPLPTPKPAVRPKPPAIKAPPVCGKATITIQRIAVPLP